MMGFVDNNRDEGIMIVYILSRPMLRQFKSNTPKNDTIKSLFNRVLRIVERGNKRYLYGAEKHVFSNNNQ